MANDNKTGSVNDSDTIVIDGKVFLVPVSILLSGLMISISLFLGLRSIGDTTISTSKPTSSGTVVTPTESPIKGNVVSSIENDAVMGDKSTAKIAIIEYSDYECPACQYFFTQSYNDVVNQYIKTGKAIYVYRDFIAIPSHNPNATLEATAAECVKKYAGDQKYFEYHDYIFANTQANGSGLTGGKTDLINKAVSMGINKDQFTACFDDATIATEIKADQADATKIGMNGTPSFVIGKLNSDGSVDGVYLTGALPASVFGEVIDQQLSR